MSSPLGATLPVVNPTCELHEKKANQTASEEKLVSALATSALGYSPTELPSLIEKEVTVSLSAGARALTREQMIEDVVRAQFVIQWDAVDSLLEKHLSQIISCVESRLQGVEAGRKKGVDSRSSLASQSVEKHYISLMKEKVSIIMETGEVMNAIREIVLSLTESELEFYHAVVTRPETRGVYKKMRSAFENLVPLLNEVFTKNNSLAMFRTLRDLNVPIAKEKAGEVLKQYYAGKQQRAQMIQELASWPEEERSEVIAELFHMPDSFAAGDILEMIDAPRAAKP